MYLYSNKNIPFPDVSLTVRIREEPFWSGPPLRSNLIGRPRKLEFCDLGSSRGIRNLEILQILTRIRIQKTEKYEQEREKDGNFEERKAGGRRRSFWGLVEPAVTWVYSHGRCMHRCKSSVKTKNGFELGEIREKDWRFDVLSLLLSNCSCFSLFFLCFEWEENMYI